MSLLTASALECRFNRLTSVNLLSGLEAAQVSVKIRNVPLEKRSRKRLIPGTYLPTSTELPARNISSDDI